MPFRLPICLTESTISAGRQRAAKRKFQRHPRFVIPAKAGTNPSPRPLLNLSEFSRSPPFLLRTPPRRCLSNGSRIWPLSYARTFLVGSSNKCALILLRAQRGEGGSCETTDGWGGVWFSKERPHLSRAKGRARHLPPPRKRGRRRMRRWVNSNSNFRRDDGRVRLIAPTRFLFMSKPAKSVSEEGLEN